MTALPKNHWRSFGARLAIALVGTAVITTSGLVISKRVADRTLDGTPSVDFGDGILAEDELDDEVAEPTNFLIVGSDSRGDAEVEDGADLGEVTGQRSDTIMVAHVDPRTKTAAVVSFPRDLIVDIPGHGRQKINAAFNADLGGGPELLVMTLKQNFNIDVSHYLEIDFGGFARIVDTIGKVKIFFPAPAYDMYTGLRVKFPGCAQLNGIDALAYVRSRHYYYLDYEDDRWRSDPTSDFGRIRRQQYFIRSLMQQALDRTARQPYKAFTLIDRMSDMITIDEGIEIEDVKKLARAFINSDPGAIEMFTVPTESGGGGLLLRTEEAQPMFAKLALRPLEIGVVDYSAYEIDVENADAAKGAAQTAMAELAALGFSRGQIGDADSVARTELHYTTEIGRAAVEFVRLFLGGIGEPVEVESIASGADVVLVLGPDFKAVQDPGVAPSTTSTSVVTQPTISPNPGEIPPELDDGKTHAQLVGCD